MILGPRCASTGCSARRKRARSRSTRAGSELQAAGQAGGGEQWARRALCRRQAASQGAGVHRIHSVAGAPRRGHALPASAPAPPAQAPGRARSGCTCARAPGSCGKPGSPPSAVSPPPAPAPARRQGRAGCRGVQLIDGSAEHCQRTRERWRRSGGSSTGAGRGTPSAAWRAHAAHLGAQQAHGRRLRVHGDVQEHHGLVCRAGRAALWPQQQAVALCAVPRRRAGLGGCAWRGAPSGLGGSWPGMYKQSAQQPT